MIRYAEFCTGVGGFRLGIEASGISAEPVYTNEIDDNCEKTYTTGTVCATSFMNMRLSWQRKII